MKSFNTLYYGPFLTNSHYNDSYYFADVHQSISCPLIKGRVAMRAG